MHCINRLIPADFGFQLRMNPIPVDSCFGRSQHRTAPILDNSDFVFVFKWPRLRTTLTQGNFDFDFDSGRIRLRTNLTLDAFHFNFNSNSGRLWLQPISTTDDTYSKRFRLQMTPNEFDSRRFGLRMTWILDDFDSDLNSRRFWTISSGSGVGSEIFGFESESTLNFYQLYPSLFHTVFHLIFKSSRL